MKQEFYFLDEDYSIRYAKAIVEKKECEVKECSLCRGRKITVISNLMVSFQGKKEADMYFPPNYMIANPKVYNLLKENDIQGFKLRELNILGSYPNKREPIKIDVSGLKELVVTGRCGCLRHLDGSLVEHCEKCKRVPMEVKRSVHGFSVNLDEWDGSDIFQFENFGRPVVTEKLKNLLEEAGIRNIQFQNIKDFKFKYC